MLIPSIDLQGRRRRPARAGRAPRHQRRRRVPLGAAVRALPEGAGHRSRRRHGHRRQPRRSSGRSPARCRAASAAASAPSSARTRRARGRRAADHRRLGALQGRPARPRVRASARRRGRRASSVIAAVDSRGGHVVIHGWKTVAAADRRRGRPRARAVLRRVPLHARRHRRADGGTDIEAILAVRRATTRRVTAAGGITTQEEIDELDAHGVDAVVGMAIYTGKLSISS